MNQDYLIYALMAAAALLLGSSGWSAAPRLLAWLRSRVEKPGQFDLYAADDLAALRALDRRAEALGCPKFSAHLKELKQCFFAQQVEGRPDETA